MSTEFSLQLSFHSTAFPTHVGVGPHGAEPHYVPRNSSDRFIARDTTVVIDSGGQYESKWRIGAAAQRGAPGIKKQPWKTKTHRNGTLLAKFWLENIRIEILMTVRRGGNHKQFRGIP